MERRAFLGFAALPFSAWAAKVKYPAAKPGRKLVFPRDHGAHPDYRIEWWYVTGWLDEPLGFQITFFRARPEEQTDNPSGFNPRQVLFAHAALSDPKRGRLLHDQRAARAGFSLADAELERTGVWIDDWKLELNGNVYHAKLSARDFDFELPRLVSLHFPFVPVYTQPVIPDHNIKTRNPHMKASTIVASAAAFLAAAAFTQPGVAADRFILVKNNYAKEYVWITTYNTLPRQIQYGCVKPGETKTFTDNQYGSSFRIRAEVMTAAECKGTKLCDTNAASSNSAGFSVNRNKTDPNNCYIAYGVDKK